MLVKATSSRLVYFYSFLKTEAANVATRQSLELYYITERNISLNQVLPPVPTGKIVIVIPTVFVTKLQFQKALDEMKNSVIQKVQDEKLAGSTAIDQAVAEVAASIEEQYLEGEKKREYTDEQMTKKAFLEVLRENLVPRGFEVHGEETDVDYPYTRYYKSKDFSFFFKLVSQTELNVFVVEPEHKSEPEVEWEDVELQTCAGESKNIAKGSDMFQLIANMIKAAGCVAATAVQNEKLFWKITVYGFLCNYATETVKKVHVLKLDFKNRKSTLFNTSYNHLSIQDAINRIASKMEG